VKGVEEIEANAAAVIAANTAGILCQPPETD